MTAGDHPLPRTAMDGHNAFSAKGLTTGAAPAPLVDPFGRAIRYLRVSVTDRCDLRCVYCMAEDMTFLPKADILSLEELDRLASRFVALGTEKIRLTGKKMTEKEYIRYTGYPGGQRFATPAELLAKHPERVIEYAVQGMLPGNKLGDALYKNLHVYAGAEHPHAAQSPKEIK